MKEFRGCVDNRQEGRKAVVDEEGTRRMLFIITNWELWFWLN